MRMCKTFCVRGARLIHLKDSFGRVTSANHPESPRTDSLVFDRFRVSAGLVRGHLCKIISLRRCKWCQQRDSKTQRVLCKKFIVECKRNEIPSWQNPLFHRVFLKFSVVHTIERHVSHMRAINFNFRRAIASHGVMLHSRTHFVKRNAVFFAVL